MNTLLTPTAVAQEAILVLENNLVMANLVHRDFSREFQKVGATMEVRAAGNDDHDVNLQFSAVSAWSQDGMPVIYTASSKGRLHLPDGFTAVFDFLDRVESESVTRSPEERVTDGPNGGETSRDVVARYVLLLTRLDLAPR